MSRFKNVTIVGGGTAGWLTALHIQKISPSSNITLIESSKIGILGAGEGSVPTFTYFLKFLNIDEKEFLKETNATHKLGILFDNWNGDKKDYFHSFNSVHQKFDYAYDDYGEIGNAYIGSLYKNNIPFKVGEIAEQMARSDTSPFISESIDGLDYVPNYSFHFDAHLVAEYFKKVATKRGVKRVEGEVINFTQDSKSYITQVNLEDQSIDSDFIFDCSGFKRLIIGELFKSPWKSYTQHLKANSALTFHLPQFENKVEPYTKAICMKNGWMWQIPLQNRIGCGYVYDSDYITEQQAKTEIEQYLGHSIQQQNNITFEAGTYEKVWINNCMAVGLSGGFTEPIEATSIFNTVTQLQATEKRMFENYNQTTIDQFNYYFQKMNDEVLDFLYFHYITKRKDSKYWEDYLKTTKVPTTLQALLDRWNKEIIPVKDFSTHPFNLHSWLAVGHGLDLFNKEPFIREYEKHHFMRINQHLVYLKNWGETLSKQAYTEKEYLDKL